MPDLLSDSIYPHLLNKWTRAKAIKVATTLIVGYVFTVLSVVAISTSFNPGAPIQSSEMPQPTPSSPAVTAVNAQNNQDDGRFTDGWVYDFSKLPDGSLPQTDWNFENGVEVANYNREAQAYTSRTDNVRIEDGLLVIEAKRENLHGKDYTSARINTRGKFSFTHGTLEVDAMIPSGNGTWPAAWLMPAQDIYKPADYNISQKDTLSWVLNGEIDFMESIGSIPGENIPSAHNYNQMKKATLYTPGYVDTPYTQFHKYGVIKTPTKITFTIDGAPYAVREKTSDSPLDWPFEQPYYLILNLAIGGEWAGASGIDDATAPWQMKVKSITFTPM